MIARLYTVNMCWEETACYEIHRLSTNRSIFQQDNALAHRSRRVLHGSLLQSVLDHGILTQRSVATCNMWWDIFDDDFIANFLASLSMKGFWISISTWQVMCKNIVACFLTHSVVVIEDRHQETARCLPMTKSVSRRVACKSSFTISYTKCRNTSAVNYESINQSIISLMKGWQTATTQ